MKGIEGKRVRLGEVSAELPHKALDSRAMLEGQRLPQTQCTHGICQDATKAACVVPEEHVAYEQTEA